MDADVASSVEVLWKAARATWPGVELSLASFAAYCSARVDEHGCGSVGLAPLNTADLYLACACLEGAPGAVEVFDQAFLASVPRTVARIDSSPGFADEVCQRLREKMFVGVGRPGKLADYSGRGPLAAWVRVAALRTALNLQESNGRAHLELADEIAFAAPNTPDPEMEYLRNRYRPAFLAAVRAALEALPEDRRRVLRLHVVGRLSTTQIGAMLGVNQSTVVRWLASARKAVRADTYKRLMATLGLGAAELHSLVGVLLSRLDFSLDDDRVLGEAS
jgi:RNA polymerase sigma-70 factor (ECF subfamily)